MESVGQFQPFPHISLITPTTLCHALLPLVHSDCHHWMPAFLHRLSSPLQWCIFSSPTFGFSFHSTCHSAATFFPSRLNTLTASPLSVIQVQYVHNLVHFPATLFVCHIMPRFAFQALRVHDDNSTLIHSSLIPKSNKVFCVYILFTLSYFYQNLPLQISNILHTDSACYFI